MNSSLHQGKTLFLVILFIAFSVFTADVVDLREELRILSCPYTCLDNNITTGVASNVSIEPKPLLTLFSVTEKASVEISFLHLLSYSFRAPPFRS
jgi:hypothetical protein